MYLIGKIALTSLITYHRSWLAKQNAFSFEIGSKQPSIDSNISSFELCQPDVTSMFTNKNLRYIFPHFTSTNH